MPFVQRMLQVEPSGSGHSERLCRLGSPGQGPTASTTGDVDQGSKRVSNDVLRFVQVCRLLSCLVVHADDIFADLAVQCRQVIERTDRLNGRLRSGLSDSVARLDAKTARRRMFRVFILPTDRYLICDILLGYTLTPRHASEFYE